jgi:hypothetical protein
MALSPRPAQRPWPRWVAIAGWSILGILGTTLLVFIATLTFGGVHGTEFCPQTFERRSYSYYELPVAGIQMTGEQHEDLTGDTEKLVTSSKFIPAPTVAKKDWHVLGGSHGSRARQPGDAGILIAYLDARESGGTHRWVRWSEKHEELAKVLWPAVQELAVHDAYLSMPDAFDVAKSHTDPAKLKQELDQLLSRKLPKAEEIPETAASK